MPRALTRILALGVYPITHPVHGGQRRLARLISAYRSLDVECLYLAVFPPFVQPSEPQNATYFRSTLDNRGWLTPSPFVWDIHSGLFAAEDAKCWKWIRRHVQRFNPTHVHIEQPFMLPVYEALTSAGYSELELIYSSQNVEGPLKREILERSNHARDYIEKVVGHIDDLERRAVEAARLVICASRDEREHYESLGATDILVCRNGAEAPTTRPARQTGSAAEPPYLLTVGSGYPPNTDGFVSLLLEPALFFLPPRRALVVAGGMATGVAHHPSFQEYESANRRRLELREVVSDDELDDLKAHAHGFVVPITHGGGTNLKTAEAILSNKWVLATSVAMRGFNEFIGQDGILVEDDPRAFRDRVRDLLERPALVLDSATREGRRGVEWENSLAPLRDWIVGRGWSAAPPSAALRGVP